MIVGALAAGCVYRINIQQGNFLDQAAVDQVKPGMTRRHVDSRRVTVYFDGDKVAKLDKPTDAEAAAQDASAAQIKNGRTY
jgi:outer membrane protein assembly factor BamE (lipoprotein component of BamABCDE complex)